jgi:hypothetical protein
MDRSIAAILAGRESHPNWKHLLSEWRGRIPDGLRSHRGSLANLGHRVCDQTIGNIVRRHGLAPAPTRSQNTSWKEFIRSHMSVLAGTLPSNNPDQSS